MPSAWRPLSQKNDHAQRNHTVSYRGNAAILLRTNDNACSTRSTSSAACCANSRPSPRFGAEFYNHSPARTGPIGVSFRPTELLHRTGTLPGCCTSNLRFRLRDFNPKLRNASVMGSISVLNVDNPATIAIDRQLHQRAQRLGVGW